MCFPDQAPLDNTNESCQSLHACRYAVVRRRYAVVTTPKPREWVSAHVHEWLASHCCLLAVCSRPAYLPSALDGACLSAVCSRRCVWRCWHRRWLESHAPSLCILPPHLFFFFFCYCRDNLRSRRFHHYDRCFPQLGCRVINLFSAFLPAVTKITLK